MKPVRLRRLGNGEYQTQDGRYRVVRDWGDFGLWALIRYDAEANVADIIFDGLRLKDARAEIARLADGR